MADENSSNVQGTQVVNRRQAIKLAAGAGALSSVLGVPLASASGAGASSQDRLQIKIGFVDGANRGRKVGSVALPAEMTEFLLKGDLAQLKIEWLAQPADQKEPAKVAEHNLDPRTAESLNKFRERFR